MTEHSGEQVETARCRHYNRCALYNNSALSDVSEVEMCRRGFEVDENYRPEISQPSNFNPAHGYKFDPGGVCDAFKRYEDTSLIGVVSERVEGIMALLDDYGYWPGSEKMEVVKNCRFEVNRREVVYRWQ